MKYLNLIFYITCFCKILIIAFLMIEISIKSCRLINTINNQFCRLDGTCNQRVMWVIHILPLWFHEFVNFCFLVFMCSFLSTNVCVFILYYEKEIIHCGGQQYTNINKTNNHLSHQTIGHKKPTTYGIWKRCPSLR